MPRVNGVYQLLPDVRGIPDQPIKSAPYNQQLDDLAADANVARPISAGGTGGGTKATALTNLGFSDFVQTIIDAADKPAMVIKLGLDVGWAADLLTLSRSVANSTGGLTLFNKDTSGYGAMLGFRLGYQGGYDAARIDVENSSTGGQLRIRTADAARVLQLRVTFDHQGNATFTGPVIAPNYRSADGSVAAPAYSFGGNSIGMYRVANDTLGFSVGGKSVVFESTGAGSARIYLPSLGLAGVPDFTFAGDLDTGMFRAASDTIGFAVGGLDGFHIEKSGPSAARTLIASLGSAAAPDYTFLGDANTGMYRVANDVVSLTAGGVERLRCDTSAATAFSQFTVDQVESPTGAYIGLRLTSGSIRTSQNTASSVAHAIYYNPNGTVGSVVTSSSSTSFNTSSDQNLKENYRSFDGGALIDALNVYLFDWKAGGTGYGVKAQEAHGVFPDAITPGIGSPGDELYMPWSADYSKFVPLLLAEVKALRARVAALEAR